MQATQSATYCQIKLCPRAVRGHYIVDASLHSLLAAKVIGAILPSEIIDPDLPMKSEDVATIGIGDVTNLQCQ